MSFAMLVIAILGIFSKFLSVQSCTCIGPHHPQEHFCYSDYVIQAEIVDRNVEGNFLVFKINISKEFKMTRIARSALSNYKIYTQSDHELCGTDFQIGSELVLAGHISENLKTFINVCDFQKRTADLTLEETNGLNGIYNKGCNCRMTFCYSHDKQNECTVRKNVECIWKLDHIKRQMSNETCLPSVETKKCFWTQNQRCVEENICNNLTF